MINLPYPEVDQTNALGSQDNGMGSSIRFSQVSFPVRYFIFIFLILNHDSEKL